MRARAALLDLVLPLECGGCARPGTGWCAACDTWLHAPLARVRPRLDPCVPCWAVGSHAGPPRRAVIALKERGRRDLVAPLSRAVADAVTRLRVSGELDPPELAPLLLVPAPTRAGAARTRGGDPVARVAAGAAANLAHCSVAPLLGVRGTRDSVGLSARERAANLSGRVHVTATGRLRADANVVLLDDVLTTGATATESVRVLRSVGVGVCAVLAICAA